MSSPSTILAYIPSPSRGVLHLGPLPLRAYALFIIIGIVIAVWWGDKRWVARGGAPGTIGDVAIWAVPFGLIGGRLYHVATDHELYFGAGRNPLNALKVWDGGLGIWGAVLLGAVGAWIACRRKGIPLPALADAIGPPIVMAQAIGRIGNYFNQELYGRPTTLPWGLEIFQRLNAAGQPDDLNGVAAAGAAPILIVQPTFLYELIWDVLVAVVVVWADRRFRLGHGRAFALYVAGYCVGRLGVELLRSDPATHIFGIRINVYTAVIVFLAAMAYFLLARKGREDPALLAGPGPADGAGEGASAGGSETSSDDPTSAEDRDARAEPKPDELPAESSAEAEPDQHQRT